MIMEEIFNEDIQNEIKDYSIYELISEIKCQSYYLYLLNSEVKTSRDRDIVSIEDHVIYIYNLANKIEKKVMNNEL